MAHRFSTHPETKVLIQLFSSLQVGESIDRNRLLAIVGLTETDKLQKLYNRVNSARNYLIRPENGALVFDWDNNGSVTRLDSTQTIDKSDVYRVKNYRSSKRGLTHLATLRNKNLNPDDQRRAMAREMVFDATSRLNHLTTVKRFERVALASSKADVEAQRSLISEMMKVKV